MVAQFNLAPVVDSFAKENMKAEVPKPNIGDTVRLVGRGLGCWGWVGLYEGTAPVYSLHHLWLPQERHLVVHRGLCCWDGSVKQHHLLCTRDWGAVQATSKGSRLFSSLG